MKTPAQKLQEDILKIEKGPVHFNRRNSQEMMEKASKIFGSAKFHRLRFHQRTCYTAMPVEAGKHELEAQTFQAPIWLE